MADMCFTTCTTMQYHMKKSIKKLALSTYLNGLVNQDATSTFCAATIRVLKSTFDPINPRCRMCGLASKANNLSKITTTTDATVKSVLDDARQSHH